MSLLSLFLVSSLGLAATPEPLSVGAPGLGFSLPAINEEVAMEMVKRPRVSLSDFTGVQAAVETKAVVLYFFDRETGGDQLATLTRLQRRFGGKDVHVVAISTDTIDVGTMSTWIEAQKLDFPVLRDNYGVVSGRYQVDKLPTTVIIDSSGYLFAIGRPDAAELEEAVAAELEPLIAR